MEVANFKISEERNMGKPHRNLSEAIWYPRSHVAGTKFYVKDTENLEISCSVLSVLCRRPNGLNRFQQLTRGAGRNSGRDHIQMRYLDIYIETIHHSSCLTEYLNIFYEIEQQQQAKQNLSQNSSTTLNDTVLLYLQLHTVF